MTTRYNSDGRPDKHGCFEMINGRLTLCQGQMKPGDYIAFDIALMDSAFRDAKSEPPKSIDEALRQRFAELAKGQHMSVKELLAAMPQHQIEEIAAEVATKYVSGSAGQGVASEFGDEIGYRVASARAKHDMAQAHRPSDQRTAFVVDAALADSIRATVRERVHQLALSDDAGAGYQRSLEDGARIARKHITSNTWRG